MSVRIGSNITSLTAQRNLAEAGARLQKNSERLSSGQRINKASDDSAGLAIAMGLNASSRIFATAIRNLNDGISVTNIMQGSIASLIQIRQRQAELAEQAANGVYTSSQRNALQKEADSVSQEYHRIIETASFNGTNLIDGSEKNMRIQCGKGVDGSIAFDLADLKEKPQAIDLGSGVTSINIADVNADGKQDILKGDSSGVVKVFLNSGNSQFTESSQYTTSSTPGALATGDFNADGKIDFVVTGSSNMGTVFLNQGNGTFSEGATVGSGTASAAIAVNDYNRDGKGDIVAVDSTNAKMVLFMNNGNGTFAAGVEYSTGTNPVSIDSLTLLNDSVGDVVTADRDANQISEFICSGHGTFTTNRTYTTGTNPVAVALADFDSNHYNDVVTVDNGSNQVSVLLNQGTGDGSLNNAVSYATGSSPVSVAVGDLNADGKADIVVGDSGSNQLSVLLNRGDGTFDASVNYSVSSRPDKVQIADINGDGRVDLISGKSGGSGLDVYFGNGGGAFSAMDSTQATRVDLTSEAKARASLDYVKSSQEDLDSFLGKVGAIQSRLETAISVVTSSRENFMAAESRIMDVDVATEAAEMQRNNILQQVGSSILAQANQQPELAVSLLRG